jgi:hypothetical protein
MTRLMSTPTARFVRHYLEMVVAMLLGMAVLYVPAAVALGALGSGELSEDAPAVALLGMAVAMTVPMVAWMRHRGHGRRPAMEMAAAMLVPALGVVALLATGALTDFHELMMLEHVVMFPAMLGVMLLRRDEYSRDHAAHLAAA